MVKGSWRELEFEIARWRDAGRGVDFWWRDDDATQPCAPLARLLSLAREARVPIALAVVPAGAEPALGELLHEGVDLLQHGHDHVNRAAPGEKKSEFPSYEAPASALARLASGRERLGRLFGARALEVLAPPWNRVPAALAGDLARAGLHGLSCYGPRAACGPRLATTPELVQVNTHVDIVDWRDARRFVGEERALGLALGHLTAQREGRAEQEPTGWLTHHAVHDDAAWQFLGRAIDFVRRVDGIRWRSARELFTPRAKE